MAFASFDSVTTVLRSLRGIGSWFRGQAGDDEAEHGNGGEEELHRNGFCKDWLIEAGDEEK